MSLHLIIPPVGACSQLNSSPCVNCGPSSPRSDDCKQTAQIHRGHAFIAFSLNPLLFLTEQTSPNSVGDARSCHSISINLVEETQPGVQHVPVPVRLQIRRAQLPALLGRGELPNPGEEQQTLVAGVPLQLRGNRLHPGLLHRENTGKMRVGEPLLWLRVPSLFTSHSGAVKLNLT